MPAFLKPEAAPTRVRVISDPPGERIDHDAPEPRRPVPRAAAPEPFLERPEQGLPIESPRLTPSARVEEMRVSVSVLLAWIMALGLGMGGAMAALLFRHRVEVILSRLL